MKGIQAVVVTAVRQGISIVCALLLIQFPFGVPLSAQNPAPAPPPAQLLSPEQLDNLVAPIALYPDQLLSQVLVASTYPLEIVEASQWLQQNRNLRGQQLVDAARQMNWDPSVQALVVFPDVIGRLGSNVSWTTDLGNAFLGQQADVMSAVQRMRARARAAGRLNSDPEQTVYTQTQGGQTAIEIVPANPQVIYVPVYNPEYIWGPPVWGYYPPLYYPEVAFGFGFGAGIFLSSFFTGWGGWGFGGWGWGPNWFAGSIFLNRPFFSRFGFNNFYGRGGFGGFGGGGLWAHNPYHRLGVPYSNQGLANRFGGSYLGRGGVVRAGIGGPRGGTFGGGAAGGWRSFGSQGNRGTPGGWRSFGGGNANGFAGGRMQGPGMQANRGPAMGGGQWSRFNGNRGNYGGNYAARGAQTFRQSPSYGGSFRSAPSYGGNYGGRGMPAFRQSPSYAGNYGGRGTPAFRQAPNYGGGGFRSAPSFSGGRGFGGSRPSFSGGGGFRSSGGGGFHGGGGGFHGGGGGSHGGGGGHSRGGRR